MKKQLKWISAGVFGVATLALIGMKAVTPDLTTSSSPKSGDSVSVPELTVVPEPSSEDIKWMSMEEAVAAQKKSPKPIFIDLYTDWCGWCKVMDKKTFSQAEVAEYMNKHFYSVKFNAEKEEPITLSGRNFKLVDAGRRQIHTLAYSLLDGRMSYPSYVILTEELQRAHIFRGYKEAPIFLQELKKLENI